MNNPYEDMDMKNTVLLYSWQIFIINYYYREMPQTVTLLLKVGKVNIRIGFQTWMYKMCPTEWLQILKVLTFVMTEMWGVETKTVLHNPI